MHPYCGQWWSVLSRQWVTVTNNATYYDHLRVVFADGTQTDTTAINIRHMIESRLFTHEQE